MSGYAQGNSDAFDELYRRHAGKVYGFLKKRVGDPNVRNDLLQLIFMKLHRGRFRYDGSLPFLPWLFAISRNVVVDYYRQNKLAHIPLDQIAEPEASVSEESGAEVALADAIEQLPESNREVFRLRYERGLSFEEIAARTGLRSDAIRQRVSRSLRQLRSVLLIKGKR